MLVRGTAANETFSGTIGSDSIDGGGGGDVLTYGALLPGYDLTVVFTALGSATVTKTASGSVFGTDTVSGITTLLGGAGNDSFDLSGVFDAPSITAPVVAVVGGAGNDTINAGSRASVELDYSAAPGAVAVALQVDI